MLLFALALAPAIAIIFYIYSKDKYEREPFKNLLISFLLGVLSTIPALIIQFAIEPKLLAFFQEKTILYYGLYAFAVVGFGEELSRLSSS